MRFFTYFIIKKMRLFGVVFFDARNILCKVFRWGSFKKGLHDNLPLFCMYVNRKYWLKLGLISFRFTNNFYLFTNFSEEISNILFWFFCFVFTWRMNELKILKIYQYEIPKKMDALLFNFYFIYFIHFLLKKETVLFCRYIQWNR